MVGDDRNCAGVLAVEQEVRGGAFFGGRQKVAGVHFLCAQNAVHGSGGEAAFAQQEIGNMRLGETGLAVEEGDGERAPLDPAEQFLTKTFVHPGECHLWIVR